MSKPIVSEVWSSCKNDGFTFFAPGLVGNAAFSELEKQEQAHLAEFHPIMSGKEIAEYDEDKYEAALEKIKVCDRHMSKN